MKMNKNMLAVGTALLMILPMLLMAFPKTNAKANVSAYLPVSIDHNFRGVWYKFETPNITLLFPAKGTKPMFIWWYTEDNSTIYVVKFQGLIEYLKVHKPYYLRRFQAEGPIINDTICKDFQIRERLRERFHNDPADMFRVMDRFRELFDEMHPAFLPFSKGVWNLTISEEPIETENSAYYAFNFTLVEVPGRKFDFAKGNIQIRCRFYLTNTTETIDDEHSYTVAAGQLKFDFVVSDWKWNIDVINKFLRDVGVNFQIPENMTGLTLWLNMASITIEEFPTDEGLQIQSQFMEQVEQKSRMEGAFINGEYYSVASNEIENGADERPLQLREQFKHRVRVHFAHKRTNIPVGFLEFVPWARLLNETGDTVGFVDVTASYIAAGHHLRLFICYPYFNSTLTLEHDPTIGLASAPQLPTLLTPEIIAILMLATVIITIAILAYRRKKETINIISP